MQINWRQEYIDKFPITEEWTYHPQVCRGHRSGYGQIRLSNNFDELYQLALPQNMSQYPQASSPQPGVLFECLLLQMYDHMKNSEVLMKHFVSRYLTSSGEISKSTVDVSE